MITLKTASILTTGIREICRLNYRDELQHGKKPSAIKFMQVPFMELAREVHLLLEKFDSKEDPLFSVLQEIVIKHDLAALNVPISEYKGFRPERILRKELEQRTSMLPSRMVTVMGSTKIPDSRDSDAAYELGQNLAKNQIAVVCTETIGIMEPLLKGVISNNGITVGIVSHDDVSFSGGRIHEKSDLIKLPVVTPYPDGIIRIVLATMSGRVLIIINGREDLLPIRATKEAAYIGIPTILVNTELPNNRKHPLHIETDLGLVMEDLKKLIPLADETENLMEDSKRITTDDKTPVTVLAGTKFDENNVSEEFTEQTGVLLGENGFLPISGAGPGPMMVFNRGAQPHALTLGLNFFATYLSSNPYSDLPIVGNLKMERSDFMVLSGSAVINLGGSDATDDEILSARSFGKPIINCAPGFDYDYFGRIFRGGLNTPITEAKTPQEILQHLKKFTSQP